MKTRIALNFSGSVQNHNADDSTLTNPTMVVLQIVSRIKDF